MSQLVPIGSPMLPALVAAGERASMRFLEFFAANIRNPHTRRAYARAAEEFFGWCASVSVRSITDVRRRRWCAFIIYSAANNCSPGRRSRVRPATNSAHLFNATLRSGANSYF